MTVFICLLFLILGIISFFIPLYVSIPLLIILLIYSIYRFKKCNIVLFSIIYCLSFTIITINENINEGNNNIYIGYVYNVKDNYYILQCNFKKYYISQTDNKKEVGDILKIEGVCGDLSFSKYESKLDFAQYLNNLGVKCEIIVHKEKNIFLNPIRMRSIKQDFLVNFNVETQSVINAILFNDKDYNSEIISVANELNLIYLFSANSVYLYFLIRIIEYLLSLRLKEKIYKPLTLLILSPYLIFLWPKISAIRLFFVYVFRYINKFFLKNKFSNIQIVSLTAIAILIFDYYLIFQSGFYIGLIVSILLALNRTFIKNINKSKKIILFPIIISICIMPFIFSFNTKINIFYPFFQIILFPIQELILLCSIVSFFTFPFTNLLNFFGYILNELYNFLDHISHSLSVSSTSIIYILFYYVCLIAISFFKIYNVKKINISCVCVIVILILTPLVPIKNIAINKIHFINVGQGDCALIQNKGVNVLIDTGGNINFDIAKEVLIPYFNRQLIYKIDLVITSHNDFDHNGALSSLKENFKIDKIIDNDNSLPYKINDLYFENLNNKQWDNDNDNSLVFNLSFINKKILFTGDISKVVEEYLIENNKQIDCDILKVSHHGSKSATSVNFIKATTPETAIISCGRFNSFGHPNKEVLDTLINYEIKILRTDVDGTIIFS